MNPIVGFDLTRILQDELNWRSELHFARALHRWSFETRRMGDFMGVADPLSGRSDADREALRRLKSLARMRLRHSLARYHTYVGGFGPEALHWCVLGWAQAELGLSFGRVLAYWCQDCKARQLLGEVYQGSQFSSPSLLF